MKGISGLKLVDEEGSEDDKDGGLPMRPAIALLEEPGAVGVPAEPIPVLEVDDGAAEDRPRASTEEGAVLKC